MRRLRWVGCSLEGTAKVDYRVGAPLVVLLSLRGLLEDGLP